MTLGHWPFVLTLVAGFALLRLRLPLLVVLLGSAALGFGWYLVRPG